MDQRTRERLPVMPVLVDTVTAAYHAAVERLRLARATEPGAVFTATGQTLRRAITSHATAGKIWAEDPTTGKRRELTQEEHQAFWTWAAVEVLRHTGVRIEELTELSHHSLIHYRLPATGELIPLLQIAPSKTDSERLLVISPQLADVLSAIISRVRDDTGAIPLVVAYDYHERVWNPPMPLLFQRRYGGEHRPITGPAIRELITAALVGTGLTDASGQPLRFLPHDFRRILITDAIMHGMPPHIAQLVAGHRDINVTMGYKAVYPEEVINAHRAFIARRRARCGPGKNTAPRPMRNGTNSSATSNAENSPSAPADAPTEPIASTNTAASAARYYDPTRLNAPGSSKSTTTSSTESPKPARKAGTAKSTDSPSASLPPATNSPNSTSSAPAAAPSTSACREHHHENRTKHSATKTRSLVQKSRDQALDVHLRHFRGVWAGHARRAD
jgi:hypothetical protein